MTARFLLDTNIVSDLVRHQQARAATRIAELGEDTIATRIFVAAELRYGAAKKRSARLASQLEAILGAMEVIPFEAPADAAYSANDLLIAAQTLALEMVLVTNDEREFGRVNGLKVENWLR